MKFRVALAQIAPRLGDLKANLQQHLHWVARARAAGADLIVFPELSLTGYILQDLVSDLALPLPSEELQPLLEASKILIVFLDLLRFQVVSTSTMLPPTSRADKWPIFIANCIFLRMACLMRCGFLAWVRICVHSEPVLEPWAY